MHLIQYNRCVDFGMQYIFSVKKTRNTCFVFSLQFSCKSLDQPITALLRSIHHVTPEVQSHDTCSLPHYVYLSGVSSLVTMAIFFKMAAWLKLLLALPMLIGYLIVVELTHSEIFEDFTQLSRLVKF